MADWTEQAEQLLKSWTLAQKNVWDSWQDFAGRAGGAQKPQGFTMNPMEWFQQSISAWTDPTGVARDAGQQIFGSQFSMMRNLEMLTKAWQMIAPKLDAGQDWRSPLSDFTTNWFQQLTGGPQDLFETSKDTAALFQSYMSQWGPLLRPWMSSAIEATGSGHLGEMMLGGSAGLGRLFAMEQDEFQAAPFTGLADIPSMGVAREHQAKILRAFDAFVDLRRRMLELNKLTVGALTKSVESVMTTLVEKSKRGEKIESVRELNRLWINSADDVFTKMYVSEEYLKLQRELSSAAMTYKIMQQDVMEMVLKSLNLPTRSELDDAYKTLYELRKEVKSLKKALQEQAKPAVEAKTETHNAIKQIRTKEAATPTVAKKSPARKKTPSRAKSAR
jgi:class III poly(R)-hydroxyalkanoic acid synthase PhaE subunit